MLDIILSNKLDGGLPEGRIVELQGPPSIGKSHIALEIAKSTQKLGGIVVYVDTENATNLENLKLIGVNVYSRFVFVQAACTEEILHVIESTIMKARAMTKDVPVTVIWDSVAASSPKAELEGDYDQNTIGLQARVLGKGMRKIANIIGNQKVLLVLLNQQRQKIGVMYGDPTTVPGGMAIPYASSIRIKLNGGKHIEDKGGNPIGIEVTAKTIKNKVARPFREASFTIMFGKGVIEDEQAFDVLREYCDKSKHKGALLSNGEVACISGTTQWKNFLVTNSDGEVLHDIKFYKSEFGEKIYKNPEFKHYMNALLEAALVVKPFEEDHPTIVGPDLNSYEEVLEASGKSEKQILND
jgi:recombination protein RecA